MPSASALLNDNQSPFVQLSQIHRMANNDQAPSEYQSQQNMRSKLANGKPSTISSLPRQHNNSSQAESSLSHYSQPLENGVGPYALHKSATSERHIRLTQDHFNHNGGGTDAIPDYIHNNSHYSLPLDHDMPPSPTPTPPPPALPMRNGSCNTNGRRSFSNNNLGGKNNNNNTQSNGKISNNNGSLRRYH